VFTHETGEHLLDALLSGFTDALDVAVPPGFFTHHAVLQVTSRDDVRGNQLLAIASLETKFSNRGYPPVTIGRHGESDRRFFPFDLRLPGWFLGLVKEAFHRPVILFSYEDGLAFGSGRSIREFSLIDCLDSCREFFLSYGGHRVAVGCTLSRDNLNPFKAAVNALAAAGLSDDDLKKKIRIDSALDPAEITDSFLEKYALLEPFGVGNASPTFVTEDVDVVRGPQILQGRHCKIHVAKGGRTIEAIAWDKADWADSMGLGRRLKLAYSLQFSNYLGENRPYLSLEDIQR